MFESSSRKPTINLQMIKHGIDKQIQNEVSKRT